MKSLSVAEIKTHLSAILKDVEKGDKIAITFGRKKRTIAVIVPYNEYKQNSERKLGSLKGKMEAVFTDDFSITDEELAGL